MVTKVLGNLSGSMFIQNITYQGPAGSVLVYADVIANGTPYMVSVGPIDSSLGAGKYRIPVPACAVPTIVPCNLTVGLQAWIPGVQTMYPGSGMGRLFFYPGVGQGQLQTLTYANLYTFLASTPPPVPPPPIVPLPPPPIIIVPPPPIHVPPPPPGPPTGQVTINGIILS